MQTRCYATRIGADGSVLVDGLPPNTPAQVIVVYPQPVDLRAELDNIAELLRDHPFMSMTKDEIMAALRATREEIWEEQYGHLS